MSEGNPILDAMRQALAMFSTEALVAELVRRGHKPPEEETGKGWMSLAELAIRARRPLNSLSRTISKYRETRGQNPPGLETDRSPKGRILACRASERFFHWLGLNPGNESKPKK